MMNEIVIPSLPIINRKERTNVLAEQRRTIKINSGGGSLARPKNKGGALALHTSSRLPSPGTPSHVFILLAINFPGFPRCAKALTKNKYCKINQKTRQEQAHIRSVTKTPHTCLSSLLSIFPLFPRCAKAFYL